jgi:transposase
MPQAKSKRKTAKKYPHELTDRQWQELTGLLPKPKNKAGEPGRFPLDLRQVVNAILNLMRTGCQ